MKEVPEDYQRPEDCSWGTESRAGAEENTQRDRDSVH